MKPPRFFWQLAAVPAWRIICDILGVTASGAPGAKSPCIRNVGKALRKGAAHLFGCFFRHLGCFRRSGLHGGTGEKKLLCFFRFCLSDDFRTADGRRCGEDSRGKIGGHRGGKPCDHGGRGCGFDHRSGCRLRRGCGLDHRSGCRLDHRSGNRVRNDRGGWLRQSRRFRFRRGLWVGWLGREASGFGD